MMRTRKPLPICRPADTYTQQEEEAQHRCHHGQGEFEGALIMVQHACNWHGIDRHRNSVAHLLVAHGALLAGAHSLILLRMQARGKTSRMHAAWLTAGRGHSGHAAAEQASLQM